ncbi:hypothetical protein [Alteribacillus sp. HJP-4]|uniref:hypothetical protein n=1 Tax=Alteribacillus sp. HJP-4 TaxID=2775394 RepID=UPI0035CCD1BD
MKIKKKDIFFGGLAFSEQDDKIKLSKMAEKGWFLDSFAPLRYCLKKTHLKGSL